MYLLLAFLLTFHKGMWVRALSIAFPESISGIMDIADKMGMTDLYIQVVISGSSYYKSDYLPRSQYLTKNAPSDYSPLDSIIKYAKKKNIRVHAWINTFLVWSLDSIPDSTRHLYHNHPEWFLKDVQGKSMHHYSADDWRDYGLEGIFIDPYNPEVREFLKNVVVEIIEKFPVDGIHFDFIRYPGVFWGIIDTFRCGLIAGYTNRDMRWLTLLRYPKLELFNRWVAYNIFLENKRRKDGIIDFLKEIRKVVKNRCRISCAVFPSPSRAGYQYAQNWWEWKGLIDYPIVMSYTTDVKLFKDFLNFALYNFSSAIMGIGFLWKGMELEANTEIEYVRQQKGKGICYFDYASLDTMADLNILLDSTRIIKETPASTIENQDTNGYFKEVPLKEWSEKGKEYIRYGEDFDFVRYLFSLSLNPEIDISRLGMSRQEFIDKISADVACFEYLNRIFKHIPERLLEPPYREIEYAFIRWEQDSTKIREYAKKVKRLDKRKRIYPEAMNPLAKAVFEAEKGEVKTVETRSGIYVFRVKEMKEGRRWVKKKQVPPEFFSIYLYCTLKKHFEEMYHQ
ncbi:MAG: family 10 glycosylhydrolase [candidate division WOR-3 bacterium]|nr:family 10 glycosylhydrolase [candidate division WOR-3 bacterium]